MTAVQWFYQRILAKDIKSVFEEALEMEKQQIIEAYNDGQAIPPFDYAEKYYDRNYKKENQ